jgi:hypothetical protein
MTDDNIIRIDGRQSEPSYLNGWCDLTLDQVEDATSEMRWAKTRASAAAHCAQ